MEYCPPNTTINVIWINHGISHCFMETVTTAVLASFILIFGSIQLLMYKRYATRIEDPNQISVSKLYVFQLFLLVLVPTLSVVRFALEATFFVGAKVYGYMVSATQCGYIFYFCRLSNRAANAPITDTGHGADLLLVPLFDCSVEQRTVLFAAFGADPRPRPDTATVLDIGIHCGEFDVRQFESKRLVVSIQLVQGPRRNVAVRDALHFVFVHLCTGAEGAGHIDASRRRLYPFAE